jgi:hypothetical protein
MRSRRFATRVCARVRERIGGLAVGCIAAAALVGSAALPAHAAESRAFVVIDTGSSVRTAVVSFSGTITGLEALELAGADPVTYGYAGIGAAVCALDGVGHSAGNECLGTADDPRYWAYWRAPKGTTGWSYSNLCACRTTVRDGDVEGWRFGVGSRPRVSVCDVAPCAPPPSGPAAGAMAPGGSAGASGTTGHGSATTEPAPLGGRGVIEVPEPAAGTEPSEPGASTPVASTSPITKRDGRGGSSNDRALGGPIPRGQGSGSRGSGSPVGVLVAAALATTMGAWAVVLRRRRVPG